MKSTINVSSISTDRDTFDPIFPLTHSPCRRHNFLLFLHRLTIERTAGTNSNLSPTFVVVWCPRVISAGLARGNHTLGHPVSLMFCKPDPVKLDPAKP